MTRAIAAMGRILVDTWPALLAWYLGGSLVRAGVLALAAPIGPQSALAALLLIPIAVLARLISYIGMFLVVRRSLRAYSALAAGDPQPTTPRATVAEFTRVLTASIIPFFTLYALIGLIAEDLSDYASSAFRYALGSENGVLDVGDGPLVLVVLVVALGGRLILKMFGSRLPRWLVIVEIYLEATWVFVAVSGITAVFGTIVTWVTERNVVQWVLSAREFARDLWAPFRLAIDSIDQLVPVLIGLVLLPLAWLLIAGVVYTRSLASLLRHRVVSARMQAHLRARLARLPKAVRRQTRFFADEWNDVGSPLTLAGKIILTARVRDIAVFVLAYAVIAALGRWATVGLYTLIGPHDSLFWFTIDPLAALAISAITEPLRIALLAAAFDWCLERWKATTPPARTAAPSSRRVSSTSRRASPSRTLPPA